MHIVGGRFAYRRISALDTFTDAREISTYRLALACSIRPCPSSLVIASAGFTSLAVRPLTLLLPGSSPMVLQMVRVLPF